MLRMLQRMKCSWRLDACVWDTGRWGPGLRAGCTVCMMLNWSEGPGLRRMGCRRPAAGVRPSEDEAWPREWGAQPQPCGSPSC